jgi:hypothetical protein
MGKEKNEEKLMFDIFRQIYLGNKNTIIYKIIRINDLEDSFTNYL